MLKTAGIDDDGALYTDIEREVADLFSGNWFMKSWKAILKRRSCTAAGMIAVLRILAGCASQPVYEILPLEPYAPLQLRNCKAYSGFRECRLMLSTQYGPVSFGPVQMRGRDRQPVAHKYQVLGCTPLGRVVLPLPNYECEISEMSSGLSAGTVLVKGGTAVTFAKHLGDVGQLDYRWKKDPWSRATTRQ